MVKKEGEEERESMDRRQNSDTIYRMAHELHIQERQILDFSLPVNPLGVSKKVKAEMRKHLKYLNRYPDPDTRRIRRSLGQFHSVDPETIICGNGSTELIHLIAKAFSPRTILLPVPASPEYERACSIYGTKEVIGHWLRGEQNFDLNPDAYIQALEETLCDRFPEPSPEGVRFEMDGPSEPLSMAFLSNPSKVTGRFIEKQGLQKIADAARALHCYLVVDEAYMYFDLSRSMIGAVAGNPYLFVLRSMSYAYGLAGIRFGYAVARADCIERLQAHKAPCMVSILAQRAAAAALKDKAYRKESMDLIEEEKAFLEKSFSKLGISFLPSDINCYLLQTTSAPEICRRLRQRGILVRDFGGFPMLEGSHVGIAVKSHRENTILIRELTGILASGA